MNHLFPKSGTTVLMSRDRPGQAPMPAAAASGCHLDRNGLCAGIDQRRERLAFLEAALVTACEAAAARGAARTMQIDDRETWDHGTWQRYLKAAAQLESDYGPRMRRLLLEIGHLERLLRLPVAA